MIERKVGVTYEVRSHSHKTILSDKGKILSSDWNSELHSAPDWTKGIIKKALWHVMDVFKQMEKLEKAAKEKRARDRKS